MYESLELMINTMQHHILVLMNRLHHTLGLTYKLAMFFVRFPNSLSVLFDTTTTAAASYDNRLCHDICSYCHLTFP